MNLTLKALDATATPVERQFVIRHMFKYREHMTHMLSAQLDHTVVSEFKQFKNTIRTHGEEQTYLKLLEDFKSSSILGMYDENALMGFVVYSIGKFTCNCLPLIVLNERTVSLECLIVGQEFRHLGYGRKLFDLFCEHCRELQAKFIKWDINAFDKDALKFFKQVAPNACLQESRFTHKTLFKETKQAVPCVLSTAIPKPLERMLVSKTAKLATSIFDTLLPLSARGLSGNEYARNYLDYAKHHLITFFVPEYGRFGAIAAERISTSPFVRCTPFLDKQFWSHPYAKEILSTTVYNLTKMDPNLTRSIFILPNNYVMNYTEKCDLGCYLQSFGYRL